MKKGKEQPDQNVFHFAGALRKTARFVSGGFKGKGTKQLDISIAPLEKLE
jgi:hypothetical protein